jgi:uncharacterized protein (DUF362 family)
MKTIRDLHDTSVCVYDVGRTDYPNAPFHPPEAYPEYPFQDSGYDSDNTIYAAVRDLFYRLGMDKEHYGTPEWNPLGEIIKPGDKVVLKPNLVISEHELGQIGIEASTVHGSVIRPFVDYTYIALKGQGRITIGDSPIKEVDFPVIIQKIGVADLYAYFQQAHPEVPLEVIDYRDLHVTRDEHGVMVAAQRLEGDQRGYTIMDLEHDSMFDEVSEHASRYRSTAAVYENVMTEVHNAEHHRYSFATTVLESDVFICLAKMKTHRKAGVTLSLKNLVGLNNEKRWLPHHRVGRVSEGGDVLPDNAPMVTTVREGLHDRFTSSKYGKYGFKLVFPVLLFGYHVGVKWWLKRLKKGQEKLAWNEGDWYRNDTVWRMVLDLNHLLFYTDKQGHLTDTVQRRYFSCIDGVLAGDKEGPLHPSPKPVGLLVGGFNPIAVDLACIKLMGLDYRKIPLMMGVQRLKRPLMFAKDIHALWKSLRVVSNKADYLRLQEEETRYFQYEASAGWKGHIELDAPSDQPAQPGARPASVSQVRRVPAPAPEGAD